MCKDYFLPGTFSTETPNSSFHIMKRMRYYILKIMLTIPIILLSVDNVEQEINEGHLYHEERISAERLFDVLGEDANKATNCFGTIEKTNKDDKRNSGIYDKDDK